MTYSNYENHITETIMIIDPDILLIYSDPLGLEL